MRYLGGFLQPGDWTDECGAAAVLTTTALPASLAALKLSRVDDDDEVLIAGDDGRAVTSQAGHARLQEFADLLAACRKSLYETAGKFHWTPAPDSTADAVAISLPSPDPLLAASRPETGHRMITHAVQTHLQTAAGLLGSLGALYDAGEVFAAPGSVVRGSLESVARVFWILGDRTEVHPEQYLARAYLEEFLSAEEAKAAAGRMGDKTTAPYVGRARRWTELRADILHRFPGTTIDDIDNKGGRELAGEHLPSPTKGVTSMFEFLEREAGGTITARVALGMYDFLSNSTHPTLYPSRQRRAWIEHPSHPGEHVALEKVELGFVRKQAAVAVVAYYQALTYVTSYFGWSPDICEALELDINRVLFRTQV